MIKPDSDYWRVPRAKYRSDGFYYRFSVGYYMGPKKRFITGWFDSREAAIDYAQRLRADKPHLKIDVLESLL